MSAIQLLIEGKDMSSEVGIFSAVHDTYAGEYVDTLVLGLLDKDGTWSKWRPKTGEKLEMKLETARTGMMYIHQVCAQNGIYKVTARSIPPYKNSVRKCEWESIGFLQICQDVAGKLGLSFESHGATDHTYKRMFQQNESDTAFLMRLCHMEGCEMTIFDGKLVVYDEAQMENQTPLKSYEFTGEGDFTFFRDDSQKVGSVRVVRTRKENACGRKDTELGDKFDIDEQIMADGTAAAGEGRLITYPDLIPNDDSEAQRWAQGLLHNANKFLATGRYKLSLQLDLAAGSVISISNSRATEWNGPVFLYRVKHDYGNQISTMYFRKI